jgi:hypothetical protein
MVESLNTESAIWAMLCAFLALSIDYVTDVAVEMRPLHSYLIIILT